MSPSSDSTLPPLGFISLDITLHRPPGDPFREETWPFPLIRERAENSAESAVVSSKPYDDEFIDRFAHAGLKLAQRGAVGIITSCGFLAMAQTELAERLPIPIMTSSLVQVPSILALLPPLHVVGILTYDDERLGPSHLEKLGIPPARCKIRGAPKDGALRRHIQLGEEYVHEEISAELVAVAQLLLADHPETAALCLECTQMPVFAEAIHRATGLPVYDIYTAGCWFYSGLVSRRPQRWGSIPKDTLEGRR
ncbi:hypothetical protein BX600DRAFT_554424 [Xylariales sp. PMI_506]|nr:hypothetical protein BX600DRAFT_554424 [Xylariales sp. PMI_506]